MIKNILASFLLLTCFLSQACALPIPKPIKGSPSIFTDTYEATAGNYKISIAVPSGWGIKEVQTSSEGSASFQLFPGNGGIGCSIEVKKFDNPDLAKEAIEEIKKTFSSVTILQDGFEVKRSKAFYSCRTQGKHLIQMWYALLKKEKKHARQWRDLRNCVSISSLISPPGDKTPLPPEPSDIPSFDDLDKSFPEETSRKSLSVIELPGRGWACSHPEKTMRVIFETLPLINCSPCSDSAAAYLLQFSDDHVSGFFYLKWDQPVWDQQISNNQEPYHDHLQEMMQDIVAIEPNQKFDRDPEYYLKDGYAIFRGTPYTLITLSGEGFLFGFSIKDENALIKHDMTDYINKIKWQKLN